MPRRARRRAQQFILQSLCFALAPELLQLNLPLTCRLAGRLLAQLANLRRLQLLAQLKRVQGILGGALARLRLKPPPPLPARIRRNIVLCLLLAQRLRLLPLLAAQRGGRLVGWRHCSATQEQREHAKSRFYARFAAHGGFDFQLRQKIPIGHLRSQLDPALGCNR